jgi:hypothetical protein
MRAAQNARSIRWNIVRNARGRAASVPRRAARWQAPVLLHRARPIARFTAERRCPWQLQAVTRVTPCAYLPSDFFAPAALFFAASSTFFRNFAGSALKSSRHPSQQKKTTRSGFPAAL